MFFPFCYVLLLEQLSCTEFFLDTHLHSWGGSGEAGLLSQGDNSVGLDGAQLESLAPGVRMF